MAGNTEQQMRDLVETQSINVSIAGDHFEASPREHLVTRLRLLWLSRNVLLRIAIYGLVLATVIAFLILKRYESSTQLMPPDDQSGSGLAMAAALANK